MTYPPPPQNSFGDSGDYQSQQPSGVPSYSPHQPQQYQAPGMSPGMGPGPAPTGPMPTTGIPGGPLPPAVPRKSPAVPILAIALVASVIGAALFLIMWLQADSDLGESEDLAAERKSEISDLESRLSDSQSRVTELEGLESEIEDIRSESEALQACVDALEAYYDTEVDSDEEADAFDVFVDECSQWVY